MEPNLCEKCGESFSDSDMFASHLCAKTSTAYLKANKGQLENYKCPLCNEIFSMPGALKRHFRTHHGEHVLKGPFPCTVQACQFSSTVRQEYLAHLTSRHGVTLVPCTFHSCKLAFCTQGEMESHRRNHMPFHCQCCHFVTPHAKQLSDHYLEHNCPPQGQEVLTTTTGLDGGSQPVTSGRPKRKRKPNPAYASSLSQDDEEEPENRGPSTKRATKEVEKEKHSPVTDGTDTQPSKDYLAEGTEHIYRTHTCPECRRCFKMRSHLQEHLHLHFPDPNLQCVNCKRHFTSKSKLRIHMLREAGEKVHRCHLCEYSAVERNSLHRHLASVHADEAGGDAGSQVYPCPTCGQKFGQSRSLKAHMKTHNVPQDCKSAHCFQEGCSYQSSSRPALLRHIAKAHEVKAVTCRYHACNAVFRNEKDMEDHRKTHLAYHCSQCDFSCSNKTVFLQHQRQGHSGDQELCCDFCSFVTFNPVEFEQHVGHLHASEKIHSCPQCSYVTSHKRGLRRHMLMHSGEKPHKCSQCDFRCRDESYLSKHMLTHSDHKNFMCSECGYITKWKHYLNVHMRKHAGDLRYQCDQCPYRCHRTDQLNSHKLRHQAKTLICEVCGYVCKRKYELRKHMLVKHSGDGQQPTVYQCEYCTYTTFYRQALQNHENCKHTKLKEFHCALCFYSSFSSISLFLHKRKVHGYVPGDKAWLENYAAKEREKNSIDFMQDFYKNPSISHEQFNKGAPPPPSSEKQRELSDLDGSVDPNTDRGTVPAPGSETLDMANVFDIVPQDVADQTVSASAPSVNSPEEEYCTLVLTTLSNAEYSETTPMQNEADDRTPSLNCEGSVTPQEKTDITASLSETEEDNGPMEDGDYDHSDLEENDVALNSLCEPAEPAENEPQTAEEAEAGEMISSTSPSDQNRRLESEVRLKAMKQYDKDQAEAMVLEGRVQMLVVQSQDVYRCDKCSYVTRKETALNHHCQSLCHGRLKGHRCQACGAQFKQRRSLDTHLLKKCPARQQKTRAFVGLSAACLTAEKDSALTLQGQDRSIPSLDNVLARNSEDKQSDEREEEECTSDLTTRKGCVEKATVTGASKSQQKDIAQIKKHLKVNFVKKQRLSSNKDRGEEKTKFTCKLCNFSTNRLATSKRHSSNCRKKETQNRLELDEDINENPSGGEEWVEEENESTNKGSGHKFSCASCPFKCNQRRALDNHEKSGCMRPGEIQCQLCSFVAKSQFSLTNHFSFVHEKNKSAVTRPRRLHCEHCAFTCKQERCMTQHIALKHKGTRPHCCRYCPFSTMRRYRLEQHESLHTGVGRHNCDKCTKTFGTINKLRQHKTRVHDRQPSHFCSLCDFSGYTLDDIKRHSLRCHTGELQHPCTHCEARFSSDMALRNHCKRLHQLEDCFSCRQCDYTCGSETTLKTHQQNKHPLLKCTTCQESFDTKEILETHQRTHFAQRCSLCHFATKLKHVLAQHLLDEHEGGSAEDKPLKCSSCEFACRHQLVLEQHLRSHGGKRLYKCTDCQYSTRNKQKITWHIRIHTGEKPYSCEQCSYTCTDPERLKYHMRVHQEERKYLCPECGYKCKWMTQLKYHMTKHTGEKPFACKECDYRTNRADALRVHCDTQHRDVRPYICEKCGKGFKTRFLLKTHQRQHTDDRPYVCGLCRKAFRWPASLRHHYLSHTKQNPYHCRHCSYKAIQKFQVVKHLRRRHPDVPVEQGVVKDSLSVGVTLKEALSGTLDERVAEVEVEEEEEEQEGAQRKAVAREVEGEIVQATVRERTGNRGLNRGGMI